MKGRITALVATTAAAVSAAGAALWARRRRGAGEAHRAEGAHGEGRRAEQKHGAVPVTSPEAPSAAAGSEPDQAVVTEATSAGPDTLDAAGDAEVPDDLTVIRGIGAARAERLHELGVTRLAQVAGWSDADIEGIAPQLRISPERIRQDDWVGQARTATEG